MKRKTVVFGVSVPKENRLHLRSDHDPAQEGTIFCLGHLEVTMDVTPPLEHDPASCRAREVLDRVGDKWSLHVIHQLSAGTRRFTELRRSIDGISQRMLTVTLRGLERDGIVTRKMYPVMPPRVDYSLTLMGHTLVDAVATLIAWSVDHLKEIDAARADYDAREPLS
jgi:DNA-binding HxlR family transcriptional regulator